MPDGRQVSLTNAKLLIFYLNYITYKIKSQDPVVVQYLMTTLNVQ